MSSKSRKVGRVLYAIGKVLRIVGQFLGFKSKGDNSPSSKPSKE